MIQTINFSQFCDSFSDTYKNNFSYEGKRALFDYLEQLEEDTGGVIELDPIALCCEYSEHENAVDCASNYNDFTASDEDNAEAEALQFLQDRTQVIEFEGGIIIQDF